MKEKRVKPRDLFQGKIYYNGNHHRRASVSRASFVEALVQTNRGFSVKQVSLVLFEKKEHMD